MRLTKTGVFCKPHMCVKDKYMELWLKIVIVYLVCMNIIGFFSMGMDKSRAKKKQWRIPERVLFTIAFLGGSIGSFVGMQVFRHKTKHKSFVIGIPLILLLQVCGVALLFHYVNSKSAQRTDFAMGTVVTEVVYGKDCEVAVEVLQEQIQMLDTRQLSWRTDGSSIYVINQRLAQGESIPLTNQEFEWLDRTLRICEDSNGALDITIHPLIEVWGIESDSPVVPTQQQVTDAQAKTDYRQLHITETGSLYADRNTVSIDLGSVGKGIVADEIRSYLETQDIHGAVISIGGTILVYGEKPGVEEWTVAIQDPRGVQGEILGSLTMKQNGVISTSGDYERYFMDGDKRYHHILDPKSGYPAESGLSSVTIVCEEGIVSDGLSTACFVLGYENSLPLLEQYDAEAIFVTTENQVIVTEGLRSAFSLTNENYELQP